MYLDALNKLSFLWINLNQSGSSIYLKLEPKNIHFGLTNKCATNFCDPRNMPTYKSLSYYKDIIHVMLNKETIKYHKPCFNTMQENLINYFFLFFPKKVSIHQRPASLSQLIQIKIFPHLAFQARNLTFIGALEFKRTPIDDSFLFDIKKK